VDLLVDKRAARVLGSSLRRVGYTEDGVIEALGEDAFSVVPEELDAFERRVPATQLGTVVQLLFLQLPVAVEEARRALGEGPLEALGAIGLAEIGGEVVPRARLVPVVDVLLASDGFSTGHDDPEDYVATYTPTGRLCDMLTPRPQVERALDVGTGNGIHALLAARHSGSVVATDVNRKALAYTELNAALNGLTNIECRLGSLFEPVAGEEFGLITCNAPFVVSPEQRWVYRDTGHRGDELSELVVASAAEHLAVGGYATVLVSWLAEDEEEPDERALAWIERTGCDGWLLPAYDADPLEHAAGWNSHLAGGGAYGEAVDEWTRYLEELGVSSISEGAVLLHRRAGRPTPARSDEIEPDELERADEQIRTAFASRARLQELARPTDLLGERLQLELRLRLERELPGRSARVLLDEGTFSEIDTSPEAAAVLTALDGKTTLRKAVRAVARHESVPVARLEKQTLALTRELLELGALRFA
jgi:methylase of polypeptide subunit release factors